MNAFNVDQPWAELIMQGRKKIELRGKRTSHRGVIAVRATNTFLEKECIRLGVDCDTVPKGVIVGTVEIVNIIDFTQQLWEDLRDEHLSADPYLGKLKGWKLRNPIRLRFPLPYPRPLPGIYILPQKIAEGIRTAERM